MVRRDREALHQFLSTPSARRATSGFWLCLRSGLFLSTPSARRATDDRREQRLHQRISIHALREEGDVFRMIHYPIPNFISIHALREEGDVSPS